MKTSIIGLFLILFICVTGILSLTGKSFALMPPHFVNIEPQPEGPITGNTITITGYSLAYAESQAIIVDLDTGEKLEVEIDLKVEQVGHGLEMKDPPPGSIQEHSVMTITLPDISVGHRIEMSYLGLTFVWTVAEVKQGSVPSEDNN